VISTNNALQVCQFGDLSIGKLPVGEFQGEKRALRKKPINKDAKDICGLDAVPSWEGDNNEYAL